MRMRLREMMGMPRSIVRWWAKACSTETGRWSWGITQYAGGRRRGRRWTRGVWMTAEDNVVGRRSRLMHRDLISREKAICS